MHEYWLVCPTHVLFRFNRAACTRPHCFLCNLTYKRPPQWWRYFGLLDGAVKQVDSLIAPSRFSQAFHQKMGLNVPIIHLPNFVPVAETAPPAAAPAVAGTSKGPHFLFVGRLEKLKGLQTLLPVFRHYHKAQLWIAGTGGYEARLRRLAEGSRNIHFLGYVPSRQLQSLYRRAVAVIVPSIRYEGFPSVILEAFRQQTPAVVRNLGGMPEIIDESGGGCIYDTEEELMAAMDRLLAEPSYRRELGLRGYQAYRQKWTAEAHLQSYFALIREVAATKGQSLG